MFSVSLYSSLIFGKHWFIIESLVKQMSIQLCYSYFEDNIIRMGKKIQTIKLIAIFSKFVFSLGSDLLLEALISTVFFSTRPASLQNSS
mgnify:CR=1 FL=1